MADSSEFPVSCPGCGATYRIPAEMAGKPATCDNCRTDFVLPNAPSPGPAGEPQAEESNKKPSSVSFVRSFLLVATGAALVWGGGTLLKKDPDPSPAGEEAAPASADTGGIGGEDEDTAAPLPEITTTLPPRPLRHMAQAPVMPPEPPAVPSPQETAPAEPPAAEAPAAMDTPPVPAVTAEAAPAPPEPAPPVPATDSAKPETSPPAPAAAPAAAADARIRGDSRLTLEGFLQAKTMEERLGFSLNPDKIRAAMEQHYRTWPAAALPLEAMTFLTEDKVPDSNRRLHLYNVKLQDQEAPIPMAVEDTADGFRVDWPTFAESYTHALRKFFESPSETPGRFRVMMRRSHYFGPPVPGQDSLRVSYTVEPPMRDESFTVWADKDSLLYQEKLATGERAAWEAESYLIVELVWRGDETRGRWVSLSRIAADSWRGE